MSLTIIIGLPGSGKSNYARLQKDLVLHDDFIFNYYNGSLLKDLKTKTNVCVVDPRLCIKQTFDKYITEWCKLVKMSDIYLILYENNPIQCMENSPHRKKDILWLSENYEIEKYKTYNYEIKKVFSLQHK